MSLEQPPFEFGNKNILTTGLRRGLKFLRPHLREMANLTMDPFLRPHIKYEKDRLGKRLSTGDPADSLLAKNLLFLPHEVVLRASRFHMDSWLRDQFVGCLALNDPEVEYELLNNMVEHRNEKSHVPTTRLFGGRLLGERRWYFDDESNPLALIWRAKIALMEEKPLVELGIAFEDKSVWQDILNEVRTHVKDGLYCNNKEKGIEKYWLDAFEFKEPEDVVTYNQGIYTTALIAAKKLGLEVSDDEIRQAVSGYNSLIHSSGRLQLSQKIPYTDVSSLFGEFLSEWLFGTNLLERQTIEKTFLTFPRLDNNSFMVVAKEDGSCLDPSEFNEPYRPYEYQNGAEWPVFTTAARYVYENTTSQHDPEFWKQKIRALILTKNAESNVPGEKYTYDSSRVGHLWNAAVYAMAKRLMTPNDYQQAIKSKPQEASRVTLYSDSAQFPNSTL